MSATSIPSDDILLQGLECLQDKFGIVGAERFISALMAGPKDYTEWRRENLPNPSAEEFNKAAVEYCNSQLS